MKKIKPFNYYGGNFRFINELKSVAGDNYTCIAEPYSGSFAYSLNSSAKRIIFNDKNPMIHNFFMQITNPISRKDFVEKLASASFDKATFDIALRHYKNNFWGISDFDRAVYTYILLRGSFNGCMQGYSSGSNKKLKNREALRAELWTVARRLEDAEIYNKSAVQLIREIRERYKSNNNVLFLIDPPYRDSTRGAKQVYGRRGEFELSRENHIELIDEIIELHRQGFKFILQGKKNDFERLYDYKLCYLHGIRSEKLRALKNCAQPSKKGQPKDPYEEWIWTNI